MRHAVLALGLLAATPGSAFAQFSAPDEPIDEVPAPRNAFELDLWAGYTQPFGELWEGRSIDRMIDAGGAVSVDLGYRIDPELSIGGSFLYHESVPDTAIGRGSSFRGATGSVQVVYHFLPYEPVDVFVSVGTGYRALVSSFRGPANDEVAHGLQVARVLVGLDFRTSSDVALGPFIGADVNAFLWRTPEDPAADASIENPSANTFLYAGLMTRFDVGGRREVDGAPADRTALRDPRE